VLVRFTPCPHLTPAPQNMDPALAREVLGRKFSDISPGVILQVGGGERRGGLAGPLVAAPPRSPPTHP
jgi:hypothetical protein